MTDALQTLRSALSDRYTVERELGSGGMATVFLAEDVKHHRQVAIKVMAPELAAAIGSERFLREIEIAGKLQHPHIVPMYDSGNANGLLYYVMPFIDGESLDHRLARERQLPVEDVLRIAGEVASGLSYAHARGVVHRDIKPANILLSDGTAVIADFGIARAASKASDPGAITRTGTVIGTPAYMSPEQAAGDSEIDGRSDIYALGCVVYEMLVGNPPFTGSTAQAILARHSLDSVSRPSIVRPAIPEVVEDAIIRALNKAPADRFTTAIQFAEAMSAPSRMTASQRLATTQRLQAERAGGRLRPSRNALLGVGGAALAGLAAIAWLTFRPSQLTAPFLDPRHVAVLYFDDTSPGKDLGFLASGLTEALIGELSKVSPGLQVISRNGVKPFQGKVTPPDSVARALKVGTIVEGSVAATGDSFQVRVAVVSGATGAEVGQTTLRRPRAELFALQDDIAKEVALFLRRQVGQEMQLLASRTTRSVEAWELTQRAQETVRDLEQLARTGDTATAGRELARADSLLARAESHDGDWVVPVTQRGWLAYRRSRLAGAFDKSYYARWTGSGLEHAARALKKKPIDPDALELEGTLRYWRWILNLAPGKAQADQLFKDAEQDLRAAVSANPAQAAAWSTLSHLLANKSETAEAKLAALRAYEADPYLATADVILWRLFLSSYDLEDTVEAGRWCREGEVRFAGDPRFAECQLWLLTFAGQRPDVNHAWRLLGQYVDRSPAAIRPFRKLRGQFAVAAALGRAGLKDSARAVIGRSRGDVALDPTRELTYLEAFAQDVLGNRDEALRLLTTFLAINPQQRASMARGGSWWFKDLESDNRFRALLGSGS